MDAVLELALDHPTLPAAEARAVLAIAGGEAGPADGGVLRARLPEAAVDFLARRLALTHAILEDWGDAADASGLGPLVATRDLLGRTFVVRARRMGGAQPEVNASALARDLGAILARSGKVDLGKPEIEVRVLLAGRAHVGRVLVDVDRPGFEARHVRNRPFFSPVTLHPRLARCLVNLARVREGDRVLDPFCGTGGTALETALVGARVLASDIDPRMVAGTRATLEHFGVHDAVVEERDVGEAPQFAPALDAIVTDPPYGRSATTAREGTEKLYARFFAAAAAALKPGGRVSGAFPSRAAVEAPRAGLALEEAHDVRVHASLTRTFAVWRRE